MEGIANYRKLNTDFMVDKGVSESVLAWVLYPPRQVNTSIV